MLHFTVIIVLSALCQGYTVHLPETVIDLTYPLSNKTDVFPGLTPFNLTIDYRGPRNKDPWLELNSICMSEHTGTHLDAPSHFHEGKWRVHQIPAERLIGPALVIDITEKAAANPDYALTADDLEDWENKNGRIDDGAILLLRSGWGKYRADPVKFWGNDKGDRSDMHFPGYGVDAAKWLTQNRKIYGVGTDGPSLDVGQRRMGAEAHRILFKDNIYGLEVVANLEKVPTRGGTLYALPMNIVDGGGSPARVLLTIGSRAETGGAAGVAAGVLVTVVADLAATLLLL